MLDINEVYGYECVLDTQSFEYPVAGYKWMLSNVLYNSVYQIGNVTCELQQL